MPGLRKFREERSFGYHPLLCFLDATGEALAGLLRPGNSGSNTATDHITVLDLALAQIPDHLRHGEDILIRCDSAGASHAFLRQSAACASRVCARSSRSGSPSPNPSAPPSPPASTGPLPSTPTASYATV